MANSLGNTTCSKGHLHPPWNTTGVLRVAKCESVCGFCQKETKTAANLRKHVAIHIKNEGLNLTVAEGSSGRGRLEIPQSLDRDSSSSSRISYSDEMDTDSVPAPTRSQTGTPRRRIGPAPGPGGGAHLTDTFSPSEVLMSMHQQHSNPGAGMASGSGSNYTHTRASYSSSSSQRHSLSIPHSQPTTPIPLPISLPLSTGSSSSSLPYLSQSQPYTTGPTHSSPPTHLTQQQHHETYSHPTNALSLLYPQHPPTDLFRTLRQHKIRTKTAWTVIPASEGFRILDLCKSLSAAESQPVSSSQNQNPTSSNSLPSNSMEGGTGGVGNVGQGAELKTPCYNRETIFDEEWQAHMRDVHGVFLLWPETWMRRIEVLDLDPFGGDIGGVNEVIMES